MKRILLSIILINLLSACQMYHIPEHNMKNEFNVEQARNLMKTGNNKIVGNAFFRQDGGGVVTCAGREVSLIPATAYAEERMSYLYNSGEHGVNLIKGSIYDATLTRNYNFIPDSTDYHALTKKTVCDSSGIFKFNNIADGSFFIVVAVDWRVQQGVNGGCLMQKVTVKNGQTQEVIMAP